MNKIIFTQAFLIVFSFLFSFSNINASSVNLDGLPLIKTSKLLVSEAVHEAKVVIRLTKPAIMNTVFFVSTRSGGAEVISDFELLSLHRISIEKGKRIAYLNLRITDDNTVEPSENFQLEILNGVGLGEHLAIVDVTITDDDEPKDLAVNHVPSSDQVKVSVFEEVGIFPNPARDKVVIDFKDLMYSQVMIDLVNLDGQLVHTYYVDAESNNLLKLDISTYPTALYIVKIRSDDRIISQKKLTIIRTR